MTSLFRVPELNIFLINTNVPRSTKAMVAGLRQRYEEVSLVFLVCKSSSFNNEVEGNVLCY